MVAKKSPSLKPTIKRPFNRRLLLILAAAVVLAGVVLAGLELTGTTNLIHIHKIPADSSSGPTPEQKKEEAKVEADQKKQAIENPPQTSPPPTPTASSISMSIRQESNGTVTVLTNLGNIADGSCSLSVTNGGSTTSQTANVIYQPQFSSCAGFSVPISSVGSGNWTLTLDVTSAGTTVTKSIQAEVK